MQDLLQVIMFIGLISLVSILMSRFYLSVTKSINQDSLFSKMRKLGYLLPILTLIGVITFVIAIVHASRNVADYPYVFTIGALLTQFSMVVVVFFSKETRKRALASTEAKIVRFLMKAVAFLAVLAGKITIGAFRASARSRNNDDAWDAKGPWSYHGYEGYTERAKRINGNPFGKHF